VALWLRRLRSVCGKVYLTAGRPTRRVREAIRRLLHSIGQTRFMPMFRRIAEAAMLAGNTPGQKPKGLTPG
jgi:hypothetical protein